MGLQLQMGSPVTHVRKIDSETNVRIHVAVQNRKGNVPNTNNKCFFYNSFIIIEKYANHFYETHNDTYNV